MVGMVGAVNPDGIVIAWVRTGERLCGDGGRGCFGVLSSISWVQAWGESRIDVVVVTQRDSATVDRRDRR